MQLVQVFDTYYEINRDKVFHSLIIIIFELSLLVEYRYSLSLKHLAKKK